MSLQRPPAVVRQVESFRGDVLQLRSDPSPGVEDQPPVLVVFSYREIKALLSVEYLRVLRSNTLPCPLQRERGYERRQRSRKSKLHELECMKFLLRKRSLTATEWRAGESLPFGAKWDLVPRLQSTASPEAPSLRQHWCGH